MRFALVLISLFSVTCANGQARDAKSAAPLPPQETQAENAAPTSSPASVQQTYSGMPTGTNAAAVWTDNSLIVWGGRRGTWQQSNSSMDSRAYEKPALLTTAWTYDPTTNSATEFSGPGDFEPRLRATSVWTGREMIIWGGARDGGRQQYGQTLSDGVSFHPGTKSWTSLPAPPTEERAGRYGHFAVWTGSEMIIWGGTRMGPSRNQGGNYLPKPAETLLSYSPEQRRWQQVKEPDKGLYARTSLFAVWTGNTLITFAYDSVLDQNRTIQQALELQSYSPRKGKWRKRTRPPAGVRFYPSTDNDANSIWLLGMDAAQPPVLGLYRYDVNADRWHSQPIQLDQGCMVSRSAPIWTDKHVFVASPGVLCTIDRATQKSQAFSSKQIGHEISMWTGSQLLFWGGTFSNTPSGPVYRPRRISTVAGSTVSPYDPTTGNLNLPVYRPKPPPVPSPHNHNNRHKRHAPKAGTPR